MANPILKSKVKKIRRTNILKLIIIIILLVIFILLTIKLTSQLLHSKIIEKQIIELNDITYIEEVTSSEDDIYNKAEDISQDNPYYSYITLPLISVDFSELSKVNNDTVAFIRINGTNVNYPVVQTTNNTFYLNHAFDKSSNSYGWVYLDERNDLNNLDDNTIIYAHNAYNNTMFGSLKNTLKNDWFSNSNNHIIYISTKNHNSLWQIFSVYEIPTETYYLTSNFGSYNSHLEFINTITARSKFDFATTVTPEDKILTLSTCKNDNTKIVLHAKLIKLQERN